MVISIATISVIGGLCLMGVGFTNAFSGLMAKAFFLSGLVLLGLGWLNPQFVLPNPPPPNPIPVPIPPTPNPTPNPVPPGPTPTPLPASPYAQAFQLDRGTPEEAMVVAALYQKVADAITYDGTQPQPKLTKVSDVVRALQSVQQYYFSANPTPLAQRFPNLERALYTGIQQAGLVDPGKSVTLDAIKRSAAAAIFRDAGNSIALLGGQS